MMLITVTYTEVNSKAGQLIMGKDMHYYCPPQVYFIRCLYLFQRVNVKKKKKRELYCLLKKKDLYCLLIDLPSYKYKSKS